MTALFAHRDLVIAVDADDDDVHWLREFLGTSFATLAPGSARPTAAVTFGPGPGLPTRAGTWRVVFALDAEPVRLLTTETHAGLELDDPVRAMSYVVSPGGLGTVATYRGDRGHARVHLMRVVREYAHNHAVATGDLVLHAAAVVTRGRAVAIAGPKGTGKTTFMLRCLEIDGVTFLSNDRVVVCTADTPGRPLAATAMPTVVSIRSGSRVLLPKMTPRLQDCGDFRLTRTSRALVGPSPPISWGDAWHLGPSQLCEAIDREAAAASPIGAVLFLEASTDTRVSLHRLVTDDAADRLRESVLGARAGVYASEVFTTRDTRDLGPETFEARCRRMAEQVPCFSGRLPVEHETDEIDQVLRRCLELDLSPRRRAGLVARGVHVRQAWSLSGHPATVAMRLDLADGRTAKLRVYPSSAAADRVWRILHCPNGVLPRPLARQGRAIVVEFVAGTPIDVLRRRRARADADRFIRGAARALAALHGVTPPRIEREVASGSRWLIGRVAARLRRSGLIDAETAQGLRRIEVPRATPLRISHGDPGPDNFVVTPLGRVRAIDEERLALRPVAFDLARLIARWPLTRTQEHLFLAAYRRAGGSPDGFLARRPFWMATALCTSIAFRLVYDPARVDGLVKRLRHLARSI